MMPAHRKSESVSYPVLPEGFFSLLIRCWLIAEVCMKSSGLAWRLRVSLLLVEIVVGQGAIWSVAELIGMDAPRVFASCSLKGAALFAACRLWFGAAWAPLMGRD